MLVMGPIKNRIFELSKSIIFICRNFGQTGHLSAILGKPAIYQRFWANRPFISDFGQMDTEIMDIIGLLISSQITYADWANGSAIVNDCECGGNILVETKGYDYVKVSGKGHGNTCDFDYIREETKEIILFCRKQFLSLLKSIFSIKAIQPKLNDLKKSAFSVAAKFLAVYEPSYACHLIPGHGFNELAAINYRAVKMLAELAGETLTDKAYLIAL
jgi:hypothetical protein